jgi:hypothetical protein
MGPLNNTHKVCMAYRKVNKIQVAEIHISRVLQNLTCQDMVKCDTKKKTSL